MTVVTGTNLVAQHRDHLHPMLTGGGEDTVDAGPVTLLRVGVGCQSLEGPEAHDLARPEAVAKEAGEILIVQHPSAARVDAPVSRGLIGVDAGESIRLTVEEEGGPVTRHKACR